MKPKVNYSLVGGFILVLGSLIVLGSLWLSFGLSSAQYETYQVDMQEAVTGLNIESSVKYNGVDVGYVENISLNRSNPQLVSLLLNIQKDTPITQGTVATLDHLGVTGMMYVALQDKGRDLRPLTIKPGQKYPMIKTMPSLFVRLDTTLTQLTQTLNHVSQTFDHTFGPANQKNFQLVLMNLAQLTGDMAKQSGEFHQVIRNTKNNLDTLRIQTLPLANQALNKLNLLSSNLLETSEVIKQNPSVLIWGSKSVPLGPGEKP